MMSIFSFKYTILTVILALVSVWLCFYPLIYPSWFTQHYIDRTQNINVAQGFGLWAFRSTNELHSDPFYSSKTFYVYSKLCHLEHSVNADFPNWMLGAGRQYQQALCTSQVTVAQGLIVAASVLSVLTLFASIYALYSSSITKAETIISYFTLLSSLFIIIGMFIWGWPIQQDLYRIDPLSSQLTTCKSATSMNKTWNCWSFGNSFWISICSVISTSIVGYLGSLSKSEKLKLHRKTYERELQLALQASATSGENRHNRRLAGLSGSRSPAATASLGNIRTPVATNYHDYAINGRNGVAGPVQEETSAWNGNINTNTLPAWNSNTSPAISQPSAPPASSTLYPSQQRTINISDRNFLQRREHPPAPPALSTQPAPLPRSSQLSQTEFAL